MGLRGHQPQATHLPLLIAAVLQSNGPVLELGCGDTSTPMLHALLAGTGRELYSFDNDATYVERYDYLRRAWHQITCIPWNQLKYPESQFGCVLIDHAPPSQRPANVLDLKDIADFLVCHDSEDGSYGYDKVYPHFEYRIEDRRLEPWTVCLSNIKPLVADWT